MSPRVFAIVAGVIGLLSAAPAFCQDAGWANQMFEKSKLDFGIVARGSDVSYRLKVTNTHAQQVHIARVGTSCGCSAARPSQDTIEPGESAYIEVSMDTKRFMREKQSAAIITFDRPYYAEVRIPLRVYIRTDVVVTPGSANFGPVAVGAPAERTLSISYAGRSDWQIQGVKTNNEYVTADVTETARGNGRVQYDLKVSLSEQTPIGTIRDQIILMTDDVTSPEVPILVEAKVEPDITVTPEVVSFGVLRSGQPKTVTVVLRGKQPFAIDKIECENEEGMFKVRLPQDERNVHVLPMTVTPPAESGKFDELFTVTIPGRPEPVTFRAYGQVVGTTGS